MVETNIAQNIVTFIKKFYNVKDNGDIENVRYEYTFEPTKQFFKENRFIKSRSDFECFVCGGKFGKGVMRMGGIGWSASACYNCAVKRAKPTIEALDKLKKHYEDMIKEYEINKSKWDNQMMLYKLKNGN